MPVFHNPRVHGHRHRPQHPQGHNPLKRNNSVHGHEPFRPLPAPTGKDPYQLDIVKDGVLTPDQANAITAANRMVFHMVGDSGGVKTPVPQQNVARRMVQDFGADVATHPAFFYHLGDVVYFDGEATEYFPQFYEAYENYPGVIMAIPGNHDGDLTPAMQAQGVKSLDAFAANFCATSAHHTPDARDVERLAMTQPNVYWTLQATVITIVGLYTNVPGGGQLDDAQIAWLQSELGKVPLDRFLLLAMHHPIYSLDDHHSGSEYMHRILNEAVDHATGKRKPDLVCAGHVHNYQRFTRDWDNWQVPFLVAGGGGYHNLHHLPPDVVPGSKPSGEDQVTFEKGNDKEFGYLRLEVTKDTLKGEYISVPGFQDPHADPQQSAVFDSFTLTLANHQVTTP